jgi:hypothetical protein
VLTSYQLDLYCNEVLRLYNTFEMDILGKYATNLKGVDMRNLLDSQSRLSMDLYEYSLRRLATLSNTSSNVISDVMSRAAKKSLIVDDSIYVQAGLSPLPLYKDKQMLDILVANIVKTNGILSNLTMTTVQNTYSSFIKKTNMAHLKIMTDAYSYDQVIKDTIKDVAKDGLIVTYPSGVTRTIESATRMVVLTSTNQTTLKMQEERLKELGTELVEVTSHAGARPSHADWQGHIYSYNGDSKKYPDFASSTGYGTVTGLGGVNCRHSFFPYFEGTERAIVESERYVNMDGKRVTEYEASQRQRYNERNIRKYKRKADMLSKAGYDNSKELAKVKEWQKRNRDLIKETGLSRDYNREQIG